MANFYADLALLLTKGSFYAEVCIKFPWVCFMQKSKYTCLSQRENFMPTVLIKGSYPD